MWIFNFQGKNKKGKQVSILFSVSLAKGACSVQCSVMYFSFTLSIHPIFQHRCKSCSVNVRLAAVGN